jgi:small-conductance mechanosensitive channel
MEYFVSLTQIDLVFDKITFMIKFKFRLQLTSLLGVCQFSDSLKTLISKNQTLHLLFSTPATPHSDFKMTKIRRSHFKHGYFMSGLSLLSRTWLCILVRLSCSQSLGDLCLITVTFPHITVLQSLFRQAWTLLPLHLNWGLAASSTA